MFRKSIIVLLIICFAVVMTSSVSAANSNPGCYIDAPASVNEGATFTVTVSCNTMLLAFGAQYGTTLSGQATTAATAYTPGTFSTSAVPGVIVAKNTIADYAVSRQGLNTASGNFTMGSYTATAANGLTSNGSASVTIQNFKISSIAGLPIGGMLQASPNATITINNIDLALLSGNVTLASDGAVNGLKTLALTMNGTPHTQATAGSAQYAFTLAANTQFTNLNIPVAADMASHLACSKTYTVADGYGDATTQIGTITLKAGDVVSVSGDTAINIQDATAIGAQFGSTTPTGEVDINLDGIIDIYDLVHVGRNYGVSQGTC